MSVNLSFPLLRRLKCHSTCLIYVIEFCGFMYIQGLHRAGTKELWSLHDHFVKCKPKVALWLQSANLLCTILHQCISEHKCSNTLQGHWEFVGLEKQL